MKVVIVGSGNVATALGKKIYETSHEIVQVAARNIEKITKLASYFNCSFTDDLLKINANSDIYIISVSDSAVAEIAVQLKLNNKIVVHTAAAVSKEILSGCSQNYGVLYPLQTLKIDTGKLPPIPVLIDGSNIETKSALVNFAGEWADSVSFASDEERLKQHVAAVFVNNFANHLFAIAADFCNSESLNFKLLYPLLEETTARIKNIQPGLAQTGPAMRKDFETLERHTEVLAKYPAYRNLYNVLTKSIIDYYNKNND